MPSPTSPSVPLTPKHAHRKYPDSSLTMVRTRCGVTPHTSTPASSSTPYHSLWPPCPLKDVCTSALRPGYHVKSVGFPRSPESMRIWRTGAAAVWGWASERALIHISWNSDIEQAYAHLHTYCRMYRCCSFLPPLFSARENFGSTFSLWHWLPKFNSDLASLSDFVSQNLPCFAGFPATAHQII